MIVLLVFVFVMLIFVLMFCFFAWSKICEIDLETISANTAAKECRSDMKELHRTIAQIQNLQKNNTALQKEVFDLKIDNQALTMRNKWLQAELMRMESEAEKPEATL